MQSFLSCRVQSWAAVLCPWLSKRANSGCGQQQQSGERLFRGSVLLQGSPCLWTPSLDEPSQLGHSSQNWPQGQWGCCGSIPVHSAGCRTSAPAPQLSFLLFHPFGDFRSTNQNEAKGCLCSGRLPQLEPVAGWHSQLLYWHCYILWHITLHLHLLIHPSRHMAYFKHHV